MVICNSVLASLFVDQRVFSSELREEIVSLEKLFHMHGAMSRDLGVSLAAFRIIHHVLAP
jgi:hypothetical protein